MIKRLMDGPALEAGMHRMQIVDLRQLTSRQLDPLLAEEAQQWRQELLWDYRASIDLIKKFVDARSLTGSAVIEDGQPVGYAFYVLEEHKGLVGGLFVSPRYAQQELSQRLLADTLTTLGGIPKLDRVEAQLIPFGYTLDPVLSEYGFRLFSRQFMVVSLPQANGPVFDVLPGLIREGPGAGLILDRWDHRYFESCARLIQLAYANHVDGEINDQYRSESGALRFLKNIIILPGCGQFQPDASFVLRQPHAGHLAGVVLNSCVSAGVGHTTQICAVPGYQGRGLGRKLMEASLQALQFRRYTSVSLTVTSGNERAVRLYERLGFSTIKKFAAGVWTGYPR
jgi:ribosomal protein S18 acetylase RimI-like enzyme